MSTPDDSMVIRYTAKELFGQVNTKLDFLIEKVDAKADHAALVALSERVDTLEEEGNQTKAIASALLAEKTSRWTTREKLFALAFAGTTLILNVLALGPDVIHRWAG